MWGHIWKLFTPDFCKCLQFLRPTPAQLRYWVIVHSTERLPASCLCVTVWYTCKGKHIKCCYNKIASTVTDDRVSWSSLRNTPTSVSLIIWNFISSPDWLCSVHKAGYWQIKTRLIQDTFSTRLRIKNWSRFVFSIIFNIGCGPGVIVAVEFRR